MEGERAVKEATARVMKILSRAVILIPDEITGFGPDGYNAGSRPGKFGETEPWPFEEGHKPPVKLLPPDQGRDQMDSPVCGK